MNRRTIISFGLGGFALFAMMMCGCQSDGEINNEPITLAELQGNSNGGDGGGYTDNGNTDDASPQNNYVTLSKQNAKILASSMAGARVCFYRDGRLECCLTSSLSEFKNIIPGHKYEFKASSNPWGLVSYPDDKLVWSTPGTDQQGFIWSVNFYSKPYSDEIVYNLHYTGQD